MNQVDKDQEVSKGSTSHYDEHKRNGYRRVTLELRNRSHAVRITKGCNVEKILGLTARMRRKHRILHYQGEVGKKADNLIPAPVEATKPMEKVTTQMDIGCHFSG